jgi:predicted RNA-binding Zn-ribbon protein involved in translation (DUF1610 family)
MKKRLTFQCGNAACKRKFSFQQEISEKQELLFTCPFCGTELILKLEPYRKRKKSVIRGEGDGAETSEWEYIFPELILAQLRQE